MRSSTDHEIVVDGLTKVFRTRTNEQGVIGSIRGVLRPQWKETCAVDNVSFRLLRGELVGFIGPNGAGKSTTLKMLTGILHPTSGMARVAGSVPWEHRQELAFTLGTIFGQRSQLWMHLPPRDSYDLLAAVYRIPQNVARARIEDLAARFAVADLLDTPVRQLSLGQRMRCELVAALLHEPRVLYMDEPSIGLDIIAKQMLREQIRAINAAGTTVLLTSHDLDDIEDLCSRVLVINHGRIVFDGAMDVLRKKVLNRKVITVYTRSRATCPRLRGVTCTVPAAHEMRLIVDTRAAALRSVLRQIVASVDVVDIDIADPPIEDVIRELYR